MIQNPISIKEFGQNLSPDTKNDKHKNFRSVLEPRDENSQCILPWKLNPKAG